MEFGDQGQITPPYDEIRIFWKAVPLGRQRYRLQNCP
jgi:hypothetical protein